MKVFVYTYEVKPGQQTRGKIKAHTLVQAKTFLKKRHIFPTAIHEEKTGLYNQLFAPKKVESDDIVAFSQLFAGCIQTGLTVKDSLVLLSKQVESKLLQDRISEIIVDVESGSSISNAFAKHTDVFPNFFPMLLKAGEASGDLATVLDYTGQYLERISNLRKELMGVFTYPAIVSVVGLGLLVVILMFVAPTFRQVFGESGVPLPFPTQILFLLSDMITKYYLIIVSIFGCGAFAGYFANKSQRGKKMLHRAYLDIPLVGKVIKQAMLLRFLRAFDILINNNVNILEALKVLEEGTTNLCMKDIITEMRKDVSRGLSISGAIVNAKDVFPPLISNSIAMGEKSGNLGVTLARLGHFVDREITFSMKKVSSKLDPILTLGLGTMVLFIALAIYLPIFDMMATAA